MYPADPTPTARVEAGVNLGSSFAAVLLPPYRYPARVPHRFLPQSGPHKMPTPYLQLEQSRATSTEPGLVAECVLLCRMASLQAQAYSGFIGNNPGTPRLCTNTPLPTISPFASPFLPHCLFSRGTILTCPALYCRVLYCGEPLVQAGG